MPVYEYECESCGGRFEVMQKFSDPAIAECKLCKAAKVRKILSPTAFVLKGSGWYATDYASKERKKECAENSCNESKKDVKPAETKNAKPAEPACSSGTCPSGGCAAKG